MGSVASSASGHAPAVLIVDDEEAIRHLLINMFRGAGISAMAATSGQDGIEALRGAGGSIALVLLDVCMPGVDGPTTLEVMKREWPHLRFWVMTGFSGDYSAEELIERGAERILTKPFSLGDVLRACREDLGIGERRLFPRERTPSVRVTITDSGGELTPWDSWIVDRSRRGLGILGPRPVEVGTQLRVRCQGASADGSWVPVEVCRCQPVQRGWSIGCHTPDDAFPCAPSFG